MIHQQLFIGGELADISDNTEVTLIHESNLLNGGASFSSNHSLTVSLPATNRNRRLLGFPDIVQSETGAAYTWHDAEYHRNGVPVITDGQCRILKATPDEIDIALVWGMKRAVDAVFSGGSTLADIVTDAAVEFHAEAQVDTYQHAISSSTDVFYASMDTIRYLSELEYYHVSVRFHDRAWDATSLMGASSYLHPSVRMEWILDKINTANDITIDFDDPNGDIATMIVPLVSKVPNDITFNGGYKATVSEPSTWGGITGNFIRFTTANASSIIEAQSNPPEGSLRCRTAFKGILRFSVYLYINDLVLIGYPIYRAKYGYRLDISVQGASQSCIIIPEGTTFMAQERDGQGRIGFTISGSIPVDMAVGDTLTMRLTCINGGIADVTLSGGIHVNGGNVWINDIIGTLNEVQPTQMFPVHGNLPNIKTLDLVKFLCAVTGAFPVQSSTNEALSLRQVDDVFNFSSAVDWSARLLSPTDRPVAAETSYTPDGWARQNWWRWKEDETVSGNYDGGIEVDDATVDESRDVMTFPFAASDGNNVPMYTSENKFDTDTQTWHTEVKWNKVEPRVLHMEEGENGEAQAFFGFDMSQIINRYYYNLAATMNKPVVIVETVRMNDLDFMALDETKPIFLAQHGAYFALLSCELHQNGTAKAKLLKLKKQEEM